MDTIRLGTIEVQITVDGAALPVYRKDDCYWIAGEAGKAYSIVVRNVSGGRLEVLESVDGRDVLFDQPASLSNPGMVISGVWHNRGWRINDHETRDFVFADPAASIAAQATGETTNVGVIGVAAYREKEQFRTYAEDRFKGGVPVYGTTTATFSGASLRAGGQTVSDVMKTADLGTGMGASREDAVGHTSFTRKVGQPDTVQIQYRSREWLVAQGIIGPYVPDAWPGNDTGYGKYAR